ncbi:hypothetical protein Q7P37_006783 [Cladosporium fusiforme]
MEPVYSFTIPSLADDTPLDCRVYHPNHFDVVLANATDNRLPTRGAVVAHPYTPLGGSYDDSVVLSVVKRLLKEGLVVGTFNFRGASGSKGSTSWSGRPEREDYTSFAALMVYYLQQLQPPSEQLNRLSTIPSARVSRIDGVEPEPEPSPSPPSDQGPSPKGSIRAGDIILVLSGYSYGSLILSRLPPIAEILDRFESAALGSTAAEIILRARRLAKESRSSLEATQASPEPRGRRLTPADVVKPRLHASSPVVVGGEETDPHERQRSRENSRGARIVHRSVEIPYRIRARIRRRSSAARPTTKDGTMRSEESFALGATKSMSGVSIRYLLISPLLPPLAHTMVPPASFSGLRGNVDKSTGFGSMKCPALAVWGSVDSFTSNRRLKAWAERMANDGPATLKWRDVESAGHFWREPGVMKLLLDEIGGWVRDS